MPAIVRFPPGCRHGGSIRIGPKAVRWLDDYEWSVSFEVEDGTIAVLGGMAKPITKEEHEDIFWALDAVGLRPAYRRVKRGKEGSRILAPKPRRIPASATQETSMPFTVKLTMEVEKDGAAFSKTEQTYENMDYDNMQTVQETVAGSLLALGSSAPAKTAKK